MRVPLRTWKFPFGGATVSLLLGLVVVGSGLGMSLFPQSAAALSGSDFNPGYIIGDGVFTDSSSMSVADIQYFLSSKVPTCDTNGTQLTSHGNGAGGYYTRAQWGAMNGNNAPFTCLKDYVENTSTLQNNFANPTAAVPGGISAAQIIWNAAQQYQINPKVILVTLQKEQGLVTDDWPWSYEYTFAMGYACPDTAGCSSSYADFYKQVDGAAFQYRYYLTHPGAFNYWIGNNNIQYSPTAGCGSSVVNIQNAATAALYIYTPYQPNAAALANLTGSGNSCSAYGNRNFWYYFNTWFGSPYDSYTWSVVNQNAYTDSGMQTPMNLGGLGPGQRYYLTVSIKNTGNVTWENNGATPVNIGTANPHDRTSPFCDSATWLGCNRPAHLHEYTVAPGQIGSFGFWVTTPTTPGNYNELYSLLVEGVTWMGSNTISFPMVVNPAYYAYANAQTTYYTDNSKTTTISPSSMIAGQHYYVRTTLQNTGNMLWQQLGSNHVALGTANPHDHASSFCDTTWLGPAPGCNRLALLHEYYVAPGQTGSFEFWIAAPAAGSYPETFNPLAEGAAWMSGTPIGYNFKIGPAYYSYSIVNQYAYTDATMQTPVSLGSLVHGHRYFIGASVKNTGNVTWQRLGNNHTAIGTATPEDRTSNFCDGVWLGCNRPVALNEYFVAPGQIGSFNFWITAPATPGNYSEVYAPLTEGVTWMDSHTIGFPMIVN